MLPHLTPEEARIVGCLMEKSVTTPDQYPLTLNALTTACNQKTAREPVMSLKQGEVQRTARGLKEKHLVEIDENFRRGVEKYKQRLCNTPFNDLQFDSAQFAVLTLLLLRGPQTPGELRSRGTRLHAFEDNDAVVETLSSLIHRGGSDPLVVKLPRTPGRQDSEYMHLLCGPVDKEAHARRAAAPEPEETATPTEPTAASSPARTAETPPRAQTAEAPPRTKATGAPARVKTAEAPPRAGIADTPPRAKAADSPSPATPEAPPPAKTAEPAPRAGARDDTDREAKVTELVQKVEKVEAEIADLKAQLKALL